MHTQQSCVALTAVLTLIAVTAGCTKPDQTSQSAAPPVADHRAADEAAIRSLDSAWSAALAAKNVEQSTSFYAPDAVLMVPGTPMASGKDVITKGLTALMGLPGFALTVAPAKITVSGDMAYEIGDYQITTPDQHKKPHTDKGKYVVVWARQADGSWKAVVDAPTTTQ